MSRACLLISFRHIVPAPEPIFQLELEQFFVLWRLGPEPAKKTTNTFSSPLFEEDVFTYPKTMKFGFWRNSTSKCTGTRRSRNAAVSACGIWTWSINNFQYVLLFKSVCSTFQDICAYSPFNDSKEISLLVIPNLRAMRWDGTAFIQGKQIKNAFHCPFATCTEAPCPEVLWNICGVVRATWKQETHRTYVTLSKTEVTCR